MGEESVRGSPAAADSGARDMLSIVHRSLCQKDFDFFWFFFKIKLQGVILLYFLYVSKMVSVGKMSI